MSDPRDLRDLEERLVQRMDEHLQQRFAASDEMQAGLLWLHFVGKVALAVCILYAAEIRAIIEGGL